VVKTSLAAGLRSQMMPLYFSDKLSHQPQGQKKPDRPEVQNKGKKIKG